ncbi:dTDP-glucose 4,6-dehydratase [Lewinella marina]|uniref:dTDP-glucose 4,6-dehydratase n=1 Tax=Neolewinella marina TaxID=438751 RepID=A0A2G0CC08_9BACT|nr:dTDP-glucose 4,6-dehydratase [Neolewinella marina]NJB86689.1 dTDP-glucose 4,6-dehydratase [Neolewinella marina]PHK97496.1 dTDP-glucose 4,6-dehydratase [Neolewinella marina]
MITKTIMVTGGAGFIGSHLVEHLVQTYPHYNIINLDALTYAGDLANVSAVAGADNYSFLEVDITDLDAIRKIFAIYPIDTVIHLAAESHVDRSIEDPLVFVRTNVVGTATLLQAAHEAWKGNFGGKLFYHVSTDEVYGSLGETGAFTEDTPYDPRSPYSASKAGSDHFVRAWHHTYGMPTVISNCSNNYGPRQYPEKLIPVIINNAVHDRPIPVYGKGINVRDWLYVGDHVNAIDLILHRGRVGETYNIGGNDEWRNIDLVRRICATVDEQLDREVGISEGLIAFVPDRAGHDLRYAIDAEKIRTELGWTPQTDLQQGLEETVAWYLKAFSA